jgi:hypothetical protein
MRDLILGKGETTQLQRIFSHSHQLDSETFWLMIQRLLSFEVPDKRLRRARRALARLAHAGAGEREPLPCEKLVSALLALEDTRCFTDITFASWLKQSATTTPNWLNSHCLPPSATQWVIAASEDAPDFARLTESGPWSYDPRAQFLVACLQEFSDRKLSLEDFATAEKTWKTQLRHYRKQLPGSFLPRAILLVEGQTEALLIPHFAKLSGCDFNEAAVTVLASGGANQVLRRYIHWRELTGLPIISVLDGDAVEQAKSLSEHLRENDRLLSLPEGEIEDSLQLGDVLKYLNIWLSSLKYSVLISSGDLKPGVRRTTELSRLWRQRGFGDFDKIGFARIIVDNLHDAREVPQIGRQIAAWVLKSSDGK